MKLRTLLLTLVVTTLLFGRSVTVEGQNTTGSIVGTITDPTGAAIPGARVTVLNLDTQESREVTAQDSGDFNAQLLNPGNYSVTVLAPGFKQVVTSGIVVQVGRTVRANFTLEVGTEAQSVTVQADSLTLDTDSAQSGQTIVENQITQLPLNGRNFTDLLFLTAGAVQSSSEQNQFRYDSGGAISLQGSRNGSTGYTIDGTSIMDYGYDTPAYQISLDAIQEFNVQTASYSAAYGYSANQLNMSSKPGTNEYHGAVFEYIRNSALDANNYFLRAAQPLRQNQFGYSLGGPVWIPKIYNGHNKTFFFANYEGQRIRQTSVISGAVPASGDMINGVFPFPVWDPLTGQNFPNNTIPANRVSRLGRYIQSNPTLWFPAPNVANPTSTINYVAGAGAPINVDQQNYRLDHQFGTKDSLFFRAAKSDVNLLTPALSSLSDINTLQTARNYTLVGTHSFTPVLIDQLRIGYLEAQAVRDPTPITPAAYQAIGFTNLLDMPTAGYPVINFATYSNPNLPNVVNANTPYTGAGGPNNTPTSSLQALWDFQDSLSWTKGKQAITAGFGMRRVMYQMLNITTSPMGYYDFNGEFSGNQISDMLLGYSYQVDSFQAGPLGNNTTGPNPHLKFASYAPYIQDDWKASKNLTVNLGLRYEYASVPYEEQNSLVWFDSEAPGGGLFVASKATLPYGGGIYHYNGRRGPEPAPKNALAPRLGLSFRPFNNDDTVIRSGWGIFYDTSQMNEFAYSTTNYPYYFLGELTSAVGEPLVNTDNLMPPAPVASVTPYTTTTAPVAAEQFGNPYVESYTLDVQHRQHRFLKDTVIDIGYQGNRGIHLMSRRQVNQPTPCILSLGCNPDTTSPGFIPNAQRNPYYNIQNRLIVDQFIGNSNYNSLNIKTEHRGTDLTLLTEYTWSKVMDIKSSSAAVGGDAAGWDGFQDNHNIKADYARSDFDIGQRFAASMIANLPFGRGKKFAATVNPVVNGILGGWQVGGISIFQGGFPFTVQATDIGFVDGSFAMRADQVGTPYPSGFRKDPTRWMNTAAFAQPAPGHFGTSSRNVVRAPGVELFNLMAGKNFRVNDRIQIQFRIESFNALNHPQFNMPDPQVNDSTFGAISSAGPARENQGALRIEF
jgi:hypothetical protein